LAIDDDSLSIACPGNDSYEGQNGSRSDDPNEFECKAAAQRRSGCQQDQRR